MLSGSEGGALWLPAATQRGFYKYGGCRKSGISCLFGKFCLLLHAVHPIYLVYMNITRGAIAIMLLIAMSLPCSGQRLFHISRSVNRNWVCYDVNLKGGALDKANPIHVFWHNNTDRPGHENELSLIQRKLAYGYKIISVGNNEATVRLTAYKKRDIRVCRNNGRWIAQVDINGKPARLTEIQVKTKEGNPLNVLYINLVGVTLKGGANVVEKILNK